MSGLYVLNGKTPVEVSDMDEWAAKWDIDDRRVGWTDIAPGWYVSTVFLGIDHRHFGDGPPILFETMIFKDDEGQDQFRYASWDEADQGHRRIVEQQQELLRASAH